MAKNKNIMHTLSCLKGTIASSVEMVIKVLGYLVLPCCWSVSINALIVVVATFRRRSETADNCWEWP